MKLTLRALSALLSYPTADFKTHVADVRAALRDEGVLSRALLLQLKPLLHSIESEDLFTLQARYCELFDHSRTLSLHLFEHVHGDGRERGQALIDLSEQYFQHGFLIAAPELPDFLPLFLEFLSCLPTREAREWLGQPAHVLAVLEQRLSERGSCYNAVFKGLIALTGTRPDVDAVAALRARTRSQEKQTVDECWEETPVKFNIPAPPHDPPGLIARFRMAGEALHSTLKN